TPNPSNATTRIVVLSSIGPFGERPPLRGRRWVLVELALPAVVEHGRLHLALSARQPAEPRVDGSGAKGDTGDLCHLPGRHGVHLVNLVRDEEVVARGGAAGRLVAVVRQIRGLLPLQELLEPLRRARVADGQKHR